MILEFNQFYINKIQEKDAWEICEFVVSNQDRLKRYFPITLAENLTPTLSKLFTEKQILKFQNKEEFIFPIKEKETNVLVGLVFIRELDWDKKQGEFGYCIDETFKGKKIITQAVQLLSEYAFKQLDLKTLQILVYKDNTSSIEVAKNNGFEWVKTLKKEFTPTGESPLDLELYKLTYKA
ncbi:GNAT family N-acetyltransferase [Oceanihabitans sediminis]|uniref:N-acetyltransferase n=1 Tax=Oceanihabitans sediminis TaxID=1812012 RepID=A0A368PAK6_9FLAO|nr:GNAT family protein [Oceanihabitans sediminis]MDX1278086.1 GNAT family protein [Oceanihabitans sediminis]MDX1772915.1 GNAT family protein [Oceanihabitans sediminis]RBP34600.1 ribosomal-protein-alanine N-acetyltransferase [Oceanihabitans sediminis]RCU58261.1 N-acetyltransferase [Oceanihabitans sediminis]